MRCTVRVWLVLEHLRVAIRVFNSFHCGYLNLRVSNNHFSVSFKWISNKLVNCFRLGHFDSSKLFKVAHYLIFASCVQGIHHHLLVFSNSVIIFRCDQALRLLSPSFSEVCAAFLTFAKLSHASFRHTASGNLPNLVLARWMLSCNAFLLGKGEFFVGKLGLKLHTGLSVVYCVSSKTPASTLLFQMHFSSWLEGVDHLWEKLFLGSIAFRIEALFFGCLLAAGLPGLGRPSRLCRLFTICA